LLLQSWHKVESSTKIDKACLVFYYSRVKLKRICLSISVLLLSLIGLTVPLPLFAEPDIKTLENGLTVLLNPIEGAENIAVVLAYHAGADAQTASTAGLFKFLEYILFNGPATKPGISEPASPSMYSSRAASKAAQVSIASNSDFPRKKRISYLRSIRSSISFLKSAENSSSLRRTALNMPASPRERLFRTNSRTTIY